MLRRLRSADSSSRSPVAASMTFPLPEKRPDISKTKRRPNHASRNQITCVKEICRIQRSSIGSGSLHKFLGQHKKQPIFSSNATRNRISFRRKFLDLEKSPFSRNGEIKSLILLAASYYELLLWKPVFKELVFTKLVCCCLVFTEPETMRLICSKSAILSTSFLLISFELFSFNRLVF